MDSKNDAQENIAPGQTVQPIQNSPPEIATQSSSIVPGQVVAQIQPLPTEPFTSNNSQQLSLATNSKKLTKLIVICILFIVLVVAGLSYYFIFLHQEPKITRAYDSPIGVIPPFQNDQIRSGKFKISASYISGSTFTREGTFMVSDDGKVTFEMLPDVDKVNNFLKFLRDKQDSDIKPSLDDYSATPNFKYDFQSLLGYYGAFYSPNSGLGFISFAENSIRDPSSDTEGQITPTTACKVSLKNAKALISDTKLNTANLKFTIVKKGNGADLTLAPQVLDLVNSKITEFLSNCYKKESGSFAEQTIESLKKQPEILPKISYQKDPTGKWSIKYTVGAETGRLISNTNMTFLVWDVSDKVMEFKGASKSYSDYSNLFGLAYSYCRVVPVRLSEFGQSYDFFEHDNGYVYPNFLDSGFFCSTQQAVDSGYLGGSYNIIKFPDSPAVIDLSNYSDEVKKLRAMHDLGYLAEKYSQEKKAYPTAEKLKELSIGLGSDLSATAKTIQGDGSFTYTALPAGCSSKCKDYSSVYWLQAIKTNKVTFNRKAYSALP